MYKYNSSDYSYSNTNTKVYYVFLFPFICNVNEVVVQIPLEETLP